MSTENLTKIEKQANAFVATGLITKSANGYTVSRPSFRGQAVEAFHIANGKCDCHQFADTRECPHILAAEIFALDEVAQPVEKCFWCLDETIESETGEPVYCAFCGSCSKSGQPDFVEIPLTQGKVAIIDSEDAERVSQFKWTLSEKRNRKRLVSYARRTIFHNGKQKTVRLHRFILNAPDGVDVDHINGNGLDNRKCNLRLATHSQNRCNTHDKRNKHGYRGVARNKYSFIAGITYEGKQYHIGSFKTAEAAARAYDKKAIELHGEFAALNFPDEHILKVAKIDAERFNRDLFVETFTNYRAHKSYIGRTA